jgi:photosystem II stability/assembly factor-like uncharacterized protein
MAIGLSHKATAHLLVAIGTTTTQLVIDAQAFESFIRVPGDSIYAILRDPINRELVKIDVAGSTSPILTVTRGQGGSTPSAFKVGALLFASTHADHYNSIIQAGSARIVDYNPNEILSPLYAGEEIYQTGPAGCERWWKSYNGVDAYWDIITGVACGAEVYTDIGWSYEILMAGDPWTEKATITYSDPVRWIYSLCYDSSRHNLFAGTKYGGHIFKSTDGGASWSHCYDTGQDRVRSLLYDPYHDAIIAGTATGGAWYRSTDGGDNWSFINGLNQEVTCMEYAPDTYTVIAGTYTSAKIYKSTDGGASWTMKQNLGSPSPWEAYVSALAYDTSRSRFICGTGLNDGGLWVSTDDGDTWTKKKSLNDDPEGQDRIYAMCYDSANDAILCGTYNDAQLWKSSDGGETWSLKKDLSNESPAQIEIQSLIFIPGSDIILAGSSYDAQAWMSDDGGETWTMEQALENRDILAFAHDTYRGKVVAATTAAFTEACDIWTRDH